MIVQGSPEWHAERCGKVTASRVADVVASTKSGWGAMRANYMAQLIAERLTGEMTESFTSAAMQWGTDTEDHARAAYQFHTDTLVEPVGFVLHPEIAGAGASPDGLIGKDGLIEIKCPNTATHIDTLLGKSIPGKYIIQMQFQMACTGRKWCEFVSFDPRMPEDLNMVIQRIERDDAHIARLEAMVVEFIEELDAKLGELQARSTALLEPEVKRKVG